MREEEGILAYLPQRVARILGKQSRTMLDTLEEITLKPCGRLFFTSGSCCYFAAADGSLVQDPMLAYEVGRGEIAEAIDLVTGGSYYSVQDDIRMGFITVQGGHRVGICGKAAVAEQRLTSITDIASLNYRVAREVIGSADGIVGEVVCGGRVMSTLVVAPPRCGKTTLLRDITRQLSDGIPALDFPGVRVSVSDERGEIAACVGGVPQHHIGVRTDVMYGLNKATAMQMLIRSMSPAVVVTDEIGTREDAQAVRDALSAGVAVVASVHGESLSEVALRNHVYELVEERAFERVIVLAMRNGQRFVRQVIRTDEMSSAAV